MSLTKKYDFFNTIYNDYGSILYSFYFEQKKTNIYEIIAELEKIDQSLIKSCDELDSQTMCKKISELSKVCLSQQNIIHQKNDEKNEITRKLNVQVRAVQGLNEKVRELECTITTLNKELKEVYWILLKF